MVKSDRHLSIWWLAFGYFACYVPYSALTKAITSRGSLIGSDEPVPSFQILPVSAMVSMLGMFAFISAMGWWQHASSRTLAGVRVPVPGRWTLLSGMCTAGIIATTTLAYTFSGVSIVFMMLLMRGGVLVIAPMVDVVSGRRVRWFSVVALLLALSALLVTFLEKRGFALTLIATIDVAVYLAGYFVRLRLMSRLAKSDDPRASVRYFVEEQMVATPVLVFVLVALAVIGHGPLMSDIRAGFINVPNASALGLIALIGLTSQGTGVFGGLILLDRRENTFCVPVNRSSSILAGVVAMCVLWLWLDTSMPSAYQLAGAGLIILAILFLSVPGLLAVNATSAAPRAD